MTAAVVNVAVARAFLTRLDPEAERFTFQTFDDSRAKRKTLSRVVDADPANGAFDALAGANERGAGVFVTVAETDGKGRQQHNITRVRAVYVDLDGPPLAPVLDAGLEPHIVVESSPGRWHVYWLVDDCPLDQFSLVQNALIRRFDGDKSVNTIERVMRLPGFLHRKSEPFLTHVVEDVGTTTVPPYAIAEIVGTLNLDLDAPQERQKREPTADGKIAPGERHAHLFAHGRSMAKRGMTRAAVSAALHVENAVQCDPPLADAEIDNLADRAFTAKDSKDWRDDPRHHDHGGDDHDHDHHRDHHHQGDDHGGESAASPADAPRPPPLDLLKPMAAPPLRAADVPDVLASFAESQARATGFDVSILLAAGIGAACAALTDDVRLCVASGWFESARLWIAIVGGPGSGKSPGSKAAMQPVFALHREGIAAWARENEGVAEKKKPQMPQLYTSDATTEALAETLRGNTRGLLYFVDEFESWLASHDAYRQGAGKDRGEWLRLFDGGPHQVNRIIRGTPFVLNWGCSLLSATTPAALRKLAPKLPDDGLLQRFLLVLAGPMELPDGAVLRVETRQPSEAWDSVLRRLYALPAAVVRLSGDARETFNHEQADLHRLTGAFEESSPSFAAHTAKRAQMLARLALVFHALTVDNVTDDLSATTMVKAVRFLRRQERHAQAVYGSMLGANTGMSLAKDVARSILASRLESFNRRELTPRCKAFRHADEPTRQAALQLLGDCGWISTESQIFSHGALWVVDPRVHQLFAEHGEAARQRRETIRERITAGDNE